LSVQFSSHVRDGVVVKVKIKIFGVEMVFFVIIEISWRRGSRIAVGASILIVFQCDFLTYYTLVLWAETSKVSYFSTAVTGRVTHVVRIHQGRSWEVSEGC
jgi:hypothetical protein